MVARKSAKERAKRRRHNEHLVRRSPVLSPGAKLLWLELSAWAWDDPTCFPKQELLVLALQKERTTISRWLKELRKHNLVVVSRQRRGNQYVIAEEIPKKVCEDARGFNKELVRLLRAGGDVAETPPDGDEIVLPDVADVPHPDVAEMQQDPPSHVADVPHPDVAEMQRADDEVHQEEVHQEREVVQREVKRGSRPATHAFKNVEEAVEVSARCARTGEGTQVEQRTYVADDTQPEDPSELMADPVLKQPRKNRRKKRGPDLAIATTQHAMRDAGKPTTGMKVVEVPSPPVFGSEDVLALLRGEIEAKYGPKAIKHMPHTLTGVDSGKVRNAVLNKYAPDTVISMVRILVWDWEVARSSIWPHKVQVKIPTVEALVQYQETLASAVETGLNYDGADRGKWVTYASKYLVDANPSVVPEDPF